MSIEEVVGDTNIGLPSDLRVRVWESAVGCTPSFEVHEVSPYVQVFMLLQGEQRFILDGKLFEFDTLRGERPIAGVFCIARPCSLKFVSETDAPMRKIKISAPLDWVRALAGGQGVGATELSRFFSHHLNSYTFTPTSHMIAFAEQIFKPPPMLAGELVVLYRQSRGLEIMRLILSALVESEGRCGPRVISAAIRHSERMREYIMSHLDETLTIGQIAAHTGASVSTVQRRFKAHFGMTVFEFIRQKRLEAAHDALQRNGVSVAQAAFVAGYAHTSNFTAAFKRTYGVTPRFRRG